MSAARSSDKMPPPDPKGSPTVRPPRSDETSLPPAAEPATDEAPADFHGLTSDLGGGRAARTRAWWRRLGARAAGS